MSEAATDSRPRAPKDNEVWDEFAMRFRNKKTGEFTDDGDSVGARDKTECIRDIEPGPAAMAALTQPGDDVAQQEEKEMREAGRLQGDDTEYGTKYTGPTPVGGAWPTALGEYRLMSFPSTNDVLIDAVKGKTAAIINLLDACKPDPSMKGYGEVARCYAEAMTAYETAAMWAVKALTKQPR